MVEAQSSVTSVSQVLEADNVFQDQELAQERATKQCCRTGCSGHKLTTLPGCFRDL